MSKLPRLALIASDRVISEYSAYLKHLLTGLADESIPAALVCPTGCDVDSVISPSVEVIRHPASNLLLLWCRSGRMLLESLVRFKPTVLHCLCESKASVTGQLAQQLNLPYVLTVNSLQKQWGRLSTSPKLCAKIIVPAKSIAANIAQVYPGLAERIEQINIGTFADQTSNCFRQPGRLAVMVVAHPLKNASELENLLGAVKHLAIDRYEFMLVVVSSGSAEKQMRESLTTLGLLQVVTIVPRTVPWRCVLAAGDIFIQPQPTDAFNLLLLEAMGAGVVVAGCKGGVDDLIIEDKTAVVFDPDDELSIYSSLQQLFDRRDLARQLAKQAQEYLRENHTVSQMISATIRAYQQAQNWFRSQKSLLT